jgi:hypothetical protein
MPRSRAETTESPNKTSLGVFARDPRVLGERLCSAPRTRKVLAPRRREFQQRMPRSRAGTTKSTTKRASVSLQEILCVSARDPRVLGERLCFAPRTRKVLAQRRRKFQQRMPRSRAGTTKSTTKRASVSLQEILCVSARDLRVLGERSISAIDVQPSRRSRPASPA